MKFKNFQKAKEGRRKKKKKEKKKKRQKGENLAAIAFIAHQMKIKHQIKHIQRKEK